MQDRTNSSQDMFFRSVQMRLYALHKRQFVAVFVVFFLCLFFTLLIGIAGPSVIQSNEYHPDTPPKQIVNEKIYNDCIGLFVFALVGSVYIEIGLFG